MRLKWKAFCPRFSPQWIYLLLKTSSCINYTKKVFFSFPKLWSGFCEPIFLFFQTFCLYVWQRGRTRNKTWATTDTFWGKRSFFYYVWFSDDWGGRGDFDTEERHFLRESWFLGQIAGPKSEYVKMKEKGSDQEKKNEKFFYWKIAKQQMLMTIHEEGRERRKEESYSRRIGMIWDFSLFTPFPMLCLIFLLEPVTFAMIYFRLLSIPLFFCGDLQRRYD